MPTHWLVQKTSSRKLLKQVSPEVANPPVSLSRIGVENNSLRKQTNVIEKVLPNSSGYRILVTMLQIIIRNKLFSLWWFSARHSFFSFSSPFSCWSIFFLPTGRKTVSIGKFEAIVGEVRGNAQITGYHQFVVDANDPFQKGFLIWKYLL